MTTPGKITLSVNVQITNASYVSGGLQIREEVQTKPLTFSEMAEILEAFHVLIEKFREM